MGGYLVLLPEGGMRGLGSRVQVVGRWERRSWETSVSMRGHREEGG